MRLWDSPGNGLWGLESWSQQIIGDLIYVYIFSLDFETVVQDLLYVFFYTRMKSTLPTLEYLHSTKLSLYQSIKKNGVNLKHI